MSQELKHATAIEQLKMAAAQFENAASIEGAQGVEQYAQQAREIRASIAALARTQQPEQLPTDGWLQDGGLLYRLTDGRRPENRDEINVTRAEGSRSPESRARRAGELLDRIRAQQPEQVVPEDVRRDADRWRYAMDWGTKGFAVCKRVGNTGTCWEPIKTAGPIDAAIDAAMLAASGAKGE